VLSFAYAEEGGRYDAQRVTVRAEKSASGHRLRGEKRWVLDGHAADAFVVSARTGGEIDARDGISLFLVDRDTPGLTILPLAMVDSRGAARVRLAGVEVGDDRRLGGADLLARAISRATAALTAEMLGGIEEVFARTIEYLKQRKQFGVPIGSFQALKHRAAHMFCEIELTRSVVLAALAAPDDAILVSAAKARASDTFVLVSAEAIQMHGGIGATDELDIGFYYKRARVAEMTFGTSAYHRDRFGRLQGY
jgi:acyl-CoA dehydrogenase